MLIEVQYAISINIMQYLLARIQFVGTPLMLKDLLKKSTLLYLNKNQWLQTCKRFDFINMLQLLE